MKLTVTQAASQYIIQQLQLTAGDGVKFFTSPENRQPVKHGPHQEFAQDNQADRLVALTEVDGINYHINFADNWFFASHDTTVDYHPDTGLSFTYAGIDADGGASINYEKYLM